jgi:hypothetical protein
MAMQAKEAVPDEKVFAQEKLVSAEAPSVAFPPTEEKDDIGESFIGLTGVHGAEENQEDVFGAFRKKIRR